MRIFLWTICIEVLFLWTICVKVLTLCSNLNSLKMAHLHKKSRKELKEDHTSVNILPTLSKIFERIMLAQLSGFFDNVSSKYRVSEKL